MALARSPFESGEPPLYRPLQVYAFDPSHGVTLGNHLTVRVPYEALKPGPVGARLAVIDYDATNKRYYPPVDLDDARLLLEGGLAPNESDPRFHQQMVYAVTAQTLRSFEVALGRTVTFAGRDGAPLKRLRIFPHAMQAANAFYSRELEALVFGYFAASAEDPGSNLPGQVVFTCLSHDVVVHEMTHALVDGLRSHFMAPTNPDTPAFHEAFADLIALFQHFMQPEALLGTLERTSGQLFAPDLDPELQLDAQKADGDAGLRNPLIDLARQFGESLGYRRALRSAIGQPPKRGALQFVLEPHERGSILVAAVFEAFFRAYARRTRDLLHIAGFGGRSAMPEYLPPALAAHLAEEAAKVARHFTSICIRALDYCPPLDVHFGDFLRALITADASTVVVDRYDYRGALVDGFRRRGIYPEGVPSLSQESLLWKPPEDSAIRCRGLSFPLWDTNPGDPEAVAEREKQSVENTKAVRTFVDDNRGALGLTEQDSLQVGPVQLVHRVSPDSMDVFEAVVEVIQERVEDGTPYFGGITLVIKPGGQVRYSISRRISSEHIAHEREYRQLLTETYARSIYERDGGVRSLTSFQALHRGY